MAQRKYNFALGEYYHVYNRGTDKRAIFLDDSDYDRFQLLLHLTNTTQRINVRDFLVEHANPFSVEMDDSLVAIGAYCLMPNHYHILATPLVEDGLSLFMQKLSTGYSMYFNKKNSRSGSLFEGKFKSQYVDEDKYLKYLFSYIHLNPIKLIQPDWRESGIRNLTQTQKYLDSYKYSSYQDMRGVGRKEKVIIMQDQFPKYFEDVAQAKEEIDHWLSLGKT